jgi:ribosomal protein S27E
MEKKPIQSRFLKIVCPRCKKVQTVYGKSTMSVKCKNCNYLLTQPTGGKTRIKAIIRKIFIRWR